MHRIDLYKSFFTHEGDYYVARLDRFDKGEKYTFNFWAGFLGLTWFCYRKMYKQSIYIFIATSIFAVATGFTIAVINPFNVGNVLYSQFVVWPLSFIVLGFLGNNLYLKQSMKVVDELIINEKSDTVTIEKLRKKGGTSMTSALVCFGLLILLQILS